MKNINKIIFGIFIIVIINLSLPTSSLAIGGGFFKSILNIFKGGGDDVIKSGDDLLRGGKNQSANIEKSTEEILNDLGMGTRMNKKPGPSKESLIMEKVGAETHASEFKTLKESNRADYISYIRRQSDEVLEGGGDMWEFFNQESPSDNDIFKKFIMVGWIGKIYNNSEYFAKPTSEKKLLLVCSNLNETFYFSLLMEQEPKRAFLVKNINFKNNQNSLPIQELVVIEDNNDLKIMSTFPGKNNEYPNHFFTIYKDQNFYYDRIKQANVSPDIIKKKAYSNILGKNNCSKATENGLL